MSKEAEILRRCISCHDKHMCQKSRKSRGLRISGVSVLQKVTLTYCKRRIFSLITCEILRNIVYIGWLYSPVVSQNTYSMNTYVQGKMFSYYLGTF